MSDISICPICGKEMPAIGNTTLHYECLECNKEREELTRKIAEINEEWYECDNKNNMRDYLEYRVADFILQREKEIRCELENKYQDLLCKQGKEIRLDERCKVTDILDDMWCLICNVSEGNWNKQSNEWQDAALRTREKYVAQLNEKDVTIDYDVPAFIKRDEKKVEG